MITSILAEGLYPRFLGHLPLSALVLAAAYKLRGEYARLNFPHKQVASTSGLVSDPGSVSSGAAASSVTSNLSDNVFRSSALGSKLETFVAYQKVAQTTMIEGGVDSNPRIEVESQNTHGLQTSQLASPQSELTTLTRSTESYATRTDVAGVLSFQRDNCSPTSSGSCPSPDGVSASTCRSESSDSFSRMDEVSMPWSIDGLFNDDSTDVDMSWDVFHTDYGPCALTPLANIGFEEGEGCCRTLASDVSILGGAVRSETPSSPSSSTLSPVQEYGVWRDLK